MNANKLVESLRNEAASNPVFNAVATMFAMRKRTRFMVTARNLQLTMRREGFEFTKQQYVDVLKFLAGLGLGTLYKDAKGQIQALKDINYSLTSIGKTALSEMKGVKQQRKVNRFKNLPQGVDKMHKMDFMEKKSVLRKPETFPAYLTVLIEGKPVTFTGPKDLTADNLSDFLVSFRRIDKEGV